MHTAHIHHVDFAVQRCVQPDLILAERLLRMLSLCFLLLSCNGNGVFVGEYEFPSGVDENTCLCVFVDRVRVFVMF